MQNFSYKKKNQFGLQSSDLFSVNDLLNGDNMDRVSYFVCYLCILTLFFLCFSYLLLLFFQLSFFSSSCVYKY